jgi:hypothetical protein
MLYSAKQICGYRLGAMDGEIGRLKGFYFDDRTWVARYFAVDTGSWIPDRKVLISPYAVSGIYAGGRILEVRLTREKIETSPSAETHLPAARQHEREYYGHQDETSDPTELGRLEVPREREIHPPPVQFPAGTNATLPEDEEAASHLRGTQEIIGYHLHASDGDIGHIEDFIIDDENWAIRALVIATGHWWSGKNVQISPAAIKQVNWDDSRIFVNLSCADLLTAAKYEYVPTNSADPRLFRQ